MKKIRRILALLTVAVLVMSMGMGAMATGQDDEGDGDEPVTITIQNGEYDDHYYKVGADEVDYEDHTYKAIQILAAEDYDQTTKQYINVKWGTAITDDGVALLEALKADSAWAATFANYKTDPTEVDDTHPQFTAASFAKAIEGCTSTSADALAQVLKNLYASADGTPISGTDEVTLPSIGYYLIDDVTTTLDDDAANPVVLFAGPGSNKVRIKADKPSQVKQVKENEKAEWNEVSDYNIGDAVPYRITSKVPNAHYYSDYNMKFTDTMSDGLTLFDEWNGVAPSNIAAANIKVTIDNADVTQYATSITKSAHGFELTLPIKASGTDAAWAPVGEEIVIEFYGVLNQSAVIGLPGNTNKSKLEYNNNPDDATSKTETPEDTVLTFTYELDVHKTDGATGDDLAGAQFALKAKDGVHRDKYVVVNADSKLVKWQDAAPAADAQPDADGNTALLRSDDEGNFKVVGLDDGKYSLEEIKAPAGYNKIDPITIEIIAGTVHTVDGEDAAAALKEISVLVAGESADGEVAGGTVLAEVVNNSGATLPETGGIGTTVFYIIGAILVVGAGVLLISRRRMR